MLDCMHALAINNHKLIFFSCERAHIGVRVRGRLHVRLRACACLCVGLCAGAGVKYGRVRECACCVRAHARGRVLRTGTLSNSDLIP